MARTIGITTAAEDIATGLVEGHELVGKLRRYEQGVEDEPLLSLPPEGIAHRFAEEIRAVSDGQTITAVGVGLPGIINCGYPESVARLGLTWTTRYLPDDPAGPMSLPRARVEIANRSGLPHVLRFERGVECSIDRKCSLLPWNGIDRTLAPGERFVFDAQPFVQLLAIREQKLKAREVEPVALLGPYMQAISVVIAAVSRLDEPIG